VRREAAALRSQTVDELLAGRIVFGTPPGAIAESGAAADGAA
jgi:hypothetical protein